MDHIGNVLDEAAVSVAVSHPGGNALARHLLLALSQSSYAPRFYTGLFVHDPNGAPILSLLPPRLRHAVRRELKRRSQAGIPPEVVHSRLIIELPTLAAARLGFPERWSRELRRRRDNCFDRWVAGALQREQPNVFIGHDGSCLDSLRAAKAVGTVAVLNQVVGFINAWEQVLAHETGIRPEATGGLAPPHRQRVERCKQEVWEADRILVPSAYVRDTLLAECIPPDRIHLLPYGVDVERFVPRRGDRKSGPVRLLFVGQISVRKGVPCLLEAMKELAGLNVELTLVGQIIGNASILLGSGERVRHLPSVPNHEIQILYQQADAFVFPSLHEGSAFVTYEALASGLPVITTPNAGSVVRDGVEGFLVPPGDSSALAERIANLAADPVLRRDMAHAARLRAEAHTWNHYRAGLVRFLDSCRPEASD